MRRNAVRRGNLISRKPAGDWCGQHVVTLVLVESFVGTPCFTGGRVQGLGEALESACPSGSVRLLTQAIALVRAGLGVQLRVWTDGLGGRTREPSSARFRPYGNMSQTGGHAHENCEKRCSRRGAGVVERGGLENRCGREPTQGSNPCLSAIRNCFQRVFRQKSGSLHVGAEPGPHPMTAFEALSGPPRPGVGRRGSLRDRRRTRREGVSAPGTRHVSGRAGRRFWVGGSP